MSVVLNGRRKSNLYVLQVLKDKFGPTTALTYICVGLSITSKYLVEQVGTTESVQQ